jgi:hypothetical protein
LKEDASVGKDDVDPAQGREVRMRHVVLLYAKEAVPQQFVLAAMRFRCAAAYLETRNAQRALQAHGWNPP